MNMLVKFSRFGALSYCSHLDLLRCVQRTMRRAGLPMQYSQGFNPHPVLNFAQALGVGLQTRGDYFAVTLSEEVDPKAFLLRFNAHAPSGLSAILAREMGEQEKSPMALVQAAIYAFEVDPMYLEALHKAVGTLLAADSYCFVVKDREQDIRKLIHWAQCKEEGVQCCVSCGNDNLSHKVIAKVLSDISGIEGDCIQIYREDLLTKFGSDAFVRLIDMQPSQTGR